MDQYKYVFDKEFLNGVLFISINTVTEHSNLDSFTEKDPKNAQLWRKRALKRYKTDINDIYVTKACFLAEFSKIVSVCVGKLTEDEDGKITRTFEKITSEDDELSILTKLFDFLNNLPNQAIICGHGIFNYIIPTLVKRALKYELEIPKIIKINLDSKPWEGKIVDTANLWKFGGGEFLSLSTISSFLGLKMNIDELYDIDTLNYNYISKQITIKDIEMQTLNNVNLVMQLFLRLRNM